jgi:hypothetical protein
MSEKDLEIQLCKRLEAAKSDSRILMDLGLRHCTGDATSMFDLVGDRPYKIIEDDSRWNLQPEFMGEVIGGMTPDVVLRSELTKENRIYIEVKKRSELNYCKADSQVVRYFLHLLGTTWSNRGHDIRRAIIVAAPSAWFEALRNREIWEYFLRTYSPLAFSFDITLGELRIDD